MQLNINRHLVIDYTKKKLTTLPFWSISIVACREAQQSLTYGLMAKNVPAYLILWQKKSKHTIVYLFLCLV